MKAQWPLVVMAAGSLLLGIAGGAGAQDSRHDHDRGDRNQQSVRTDQRHRDSGRTADARSHHRRRRHSGRVVRAHDRQTRGPLGYIRATDRAQHRN